MSLEDEAIIDEIYDIIKLLKEKNQFYADSWRELGTLGMVYRIKDKCNRIINMVINKVGDDDDIEEEVNDILGYAILLKLNEMEEGRRW